MASYESDMDGYSIEAIRLENVCAWLEKIGAGNWRQENGQLYTESGSIRFIVSSKPASKWHAAGDCEGPSYMMHGEEVHLEIIDTERNATIESYRMTSYDFQTPNSGILGVYRRAKESVKAQDEHRKEREILQSRLKLQQILGG